MAFKSNKQQLNSHKVKGKTLSIFLTIARIAFLLIVGNIVLYPMIFMISYSLKDMDALLDVQHMWFPIKTSLSNYEAMYELMNFGSALWQTFKVQI
jgi:multiple sugar transport system permease protein